MANRIDIEIELSRGRAEALEWISSFSETERYEPRTRSEHDPESWWSPADHFIHPALVETTFNDMVRRHLRGEQGMDPNMVDATGAALRPLTELMAYVNEFTEAWKVEHQGKPLDELVRIGAAIRSQTLELLSELTDEQLASRIPGAPWSDGTVGGVLSIHAAHFRIHRGWTEAGHGPS